MGNKVEDEQQQERACTYAQAHTHTHRHIDRPQRPPRPHHTLHLATTATAAAAAPTPSQRQRRLVSSRLVSNSPLSFSFFPASLRFFFSFPNTHTHTLNFIPLLRCVFFRLLLSPPPPPPSFACLKCDCGTTQRRCQRWRRRRRRLRLLTIKSHAAFLVSICLCFNNN